MPTSDGMFIVDTDASNIGVGAVLSQQQEDSEVVLAYASRTMNKAERNYDTTRKELLAVIFAFKTFKQYLLGRHFLVRTDHSALRWLRKTPEPMAQLARWLAFIEQYDFSIQHRPGVKHGNANALSRRPDPEETGGSEVIRLGHSEEDNDSGGRWSGEESAFAAPEYGDTEHGEGPERR